MALQGCCNFRDLGGYRTTDGRVVRWRKVFRADGLSHLTDEDMEALGALGIRHVIDLRTMLEVEIRGRFGTDGGHLIEYHHLPLTDTLPGGEQAPDWGDSAFVAQRYLAMLDSGAPTLRATLELLTEPGGLPAVFHCSVGKDRTGVLAAVILGLLGVSDDDIVADYALSAGPMMQVLAGLEAEFPDSADIVARFAPVILSVDAASMAGFLAGVHARFGSFEDLASTLDVSEAVDRLRQGLLESP